MAINYDDLIYTDAHIYVRDGVPFTGEAEERFPDGTLRCRGQFSNGELNGVVEGYFPSGVKKSCVPYQQGSVHGRAVEWFENGTVKIETDVEFGMLIRRREFDELGNLLSEYVLPECDPIMEYIKKRRRSEPT